MVKRISLTGKPGAGKTTIAKILVERYGYRRASMSALLVAEYVTMFNASVPEDRHIDAGVIYQYKETYRPVLQWLGNELGFQDPDRVIDVMKLALELSGAWDHPNEPVVLDAIRGELQASAARALGFVVVDVWVDEQTQRERFGSDEEYLQVVESMKARPDIENGVENAEVHITPALSSEDAALFLFNLPKEGLSHGPADQFKNPEWPFKPGSLSIWE